MNYIENSWQQLRHMYSPFQSAKLEMLHKGPVVNLERLTYLNERRCCLSERLSEALHRAEAACDAASAVAKDFQRLKKNLPLYAVHVQRNTTRLQHLSQRRT